MATAWLPGSYAVPVAIVGSALPIYFGMMITQMMARRRGIHQLLGYLAAIGICMPLIIILLAIISIIFVFAYPLIVDQGFLACRR